MKIGKYIDAHQSLNIVEIPSFKLSMPLSKSYTILKFSIVFHCFKSLWRHKNEQ